MKRSLTKKEILKKREDIDNIFKNGSIYFSKDIKMIVCRQALGYNRIIVIPVRNFGTAVKRNAVRRKIKEIYRTSKFDIQKSYDIIFVVYKHIKPDYNNISNTINLLFKKANLYTT